VTTFYSSSNVILPGHHELRAEVTVRLAVRADLARGAVISNTALAIRPANALPGLGTRAPYTRTKQVTGAGEAQLAQAVGQSRDARC
jgi:hypothetical protein